MDRNGDPTEDVAFVRPLVKSKPFLGCSEAALFAKMAPLFVLIISHAKTQASLSTRVPPATLSMCEIFHIRIGILQRTNSFDFALF
jgi:hypothetical protein